VVPQLEMENDEVEIIQSGSVFEAGDIIKNPMSVDETDSPTTPLEHFFIA
jgi:hypothetical protein